MSANRTLAKQCGLSEQAIEYIDQLHDLLEKLIASYTLDVDYHEALELVESVEFDLQRLWKFSEDRRYHTWRNKLARRWMELTWVGRTFVCTISGVERTIEKEDVKERGLFGVGKQGFIDFGVGGGYHRIVGNITEVTKENLKEKVA